jgi:hypothetical protein
MNDEPVIRLRPRKSKDGPNENPLKSAGILRSTLRLVQVSKRGQKGREEHIRDYRNVWSAAELQAKNAEWQVVCANVFGL